ncbi:FAD binding domain-containing protein [Bradyrhizobium sp. 2TAF24]|uniref:FAD binding domain-containing protein n=1 Tax=Bradyrhizobium sp. 2TAF24 TaxID=3233011 RepID=UPI003F91B0C5
MIPAAFDYIRATSLSHALGLLQDDPDSNKLVAGGHSLIPALKLRLASPERLIDIRNLPELKGISLGDRIRIGALTTHAELLASDALHEAAPIFRQAANLIADPQVRNRGTIGGALANADPAADWPAVVLALGATLDVVGPNGPSRVAARNFFVDIMTTALAPDEILLAVEFDRPQPGTRFRYRKIRHPASGYAVVGVAVVLRPVDGAVAEATIAITGATGHAFVAVDAAAQLIGKPLSEATITTAADVASGQAECLADNYAPAAYRQHLIRTEVARALASLDGD